MRQIVGRGNKCWIEEHKQFTRSTNLLLSQENFKTLYTELISIYDGIVPITYIKYKQFIMFNKKILFF